MTTETFKEPFLGRLREILKTAKGICWEGCHKIYITMTDDDFQQQEEYGYDVIPVVDQETALATLYAWFDKSCPLRFIQVIEDGQFLDGIAQFDYEEDEEED